jgi:outer membrane autotransporter protein
VNGRALPIAALAAAFAPQEATDAGGAEESDYNGWSAFVSGNLGSGERNARDGQLGFDLESQGLMFGVDRLLGQNIVGASLNLMQLDADLSDTNGSVDTSGWSLSLYGSRGGLFAGSAPNAKFDGVHLDGSVTYGRNTYEAERELTIAGLTLARATSENDANVFALAAGTGLEAHTGRTDFDFSLGGTWSRANIDDLTEEGTGPLILFVQGQDIESLTGTLGLNVRSAFAVPFGTLLPSLRAELLHEFKSDARLVTARFLRDRLGTTFTVPLDRPDANYGRIGAGLQAVFPFGWSASVEATQDVLRSDLKFRNVQFNVLKSF